MKKFILACALVVACESIQAQNEYFQHNPEWTVMEIWSQTYPCVAYDTVTFYLNGDTLINALTYKKVYARGTCRNMWWSPNPNMSCSLTPYNYPWAGYKGAVRSAGTQVFYVQENTPQEGLLYDFNLQVGSNLPLSPWTTMDTTVTVAFIDSVYTPYGYLRKFHFSTDTSRFVMEGAMSSFGFYHYCDLMMDFSSYSMCYTLNDTAWWPQQGPDCDAILLSTPGLSPQNVSLQLVPNPATDYVDITLTGSLLQSVAVYDVFGKVVKQQEGDSKLYVGDLTPGIYMLHVTDGTSFSSSQLIVE